MDDFFALTPADGKLLYALDPMTTGSLFWALHCLAQYISRATSHGLNSDPSIPFASKGYIPQIFFDERRLVLHPVKSAYAMHYPDFDPFAG